MTRVSKPNSWQYQSGFARTELNHIVYPDDNSLRYDQQNPSSWAPSQVRLVVLIGETCAAKLQDNRRSSTAKKGILEHFDAPVADLRATTKVRTSWLDPRLAVGPAGTCHPIIVTTYIINVSSGISLAALSRSLPPSFKMIQGADMAHLALYRETTSGVRTAVDIGATETAGQSAVPAILPSAWQLFYSILLVVKTPPRASLCFISTLKRQIPEKPGP